MYLFSPLIKGEHTDKVYSYKVGICISPDEANDNKCGIFQYDKFANGTADPTKTKCIGKITSTQVAESNWEIARHI